MADERRFLDANALPEVARAYGLLRDRAQALVDHLGAAGVAAPDVLAQAGLLPRLISRTTANPPAPDRAELEAAAAQGRPVGGARRGPEGEFIRLVWASGAWEQAGEPLASQTQVLAAGQAAAAAGDRAEEVLAEAQGHSVELRDGLRAQFEATPATLHLAPEDAGSVFMNGARWRRTSDAAVADLLTRAGSDGRKWASEKTGFVDLLADVGVDGNANQDAAPGISSALEFCARKNRRLFVPDEGNYLIASGITMQPNMTIIGGNGYDSIGGEARDYARLASQWLVTAPWVFTHPDAAPDNPFQTCVTLRHLALRRHGANPSSGFRYAYLFTSTIERTYWRSFDTIILGQIVLTTRVKDNNFLDVRKSLLDTRSMVGGARQSGDSWIERNYINGSLESAEAHLIDVHFPNLLHIKNNFMDFAASCIRFSNGYANQITDNILDYSFRGVQMWDTTQGTVVQGNTVHHMDAKYRSRWVVPTPAAWEGAWAGFALDYNCGKVNFEGNQGVEAQRLISLDGAGYRDINIDASNFVVRDTDTRVYVNASDNGFANHGRNIRIPTAAWAGPDSIQGIVPVT